MILNSRRIASSGSALIEAAVGIPLIIFVLFGTIQWGIIMGTQIILGHGAATGARLVSTANPPPLTSDITTAVTNAVGTFLRTDNAHLTINQTSWTDGARNYTRVDCTYNLDLIVSTVVPSQVGGVLTLRTNATGSS